MTSRTEPHIRFDWQRAERCGTPEIVYAEGKSDEHLLSICHEAGARGTPLLFTRMDTAAHNRLTATVTLDYDAPSRTAIFGTPRPNPSLAGKIAIVCAGTSDLPVARETQRTLAYLGAEAPLFADIGVAGLWRLMSVIDELRTYRLLIAVAGMEGALFSVLAGLVEGAVIAVPSPVGYGVSDGGKAALSSALSTCAPGVLTVNIGNGVGAAIAAVKIIR